MALMGWTGTPVAADGPMEELQKELQDEAAISTQNVYLGSLNIWRPEGEWEDNTTTFLKKRLE